MPFKTDFSKVDPNHLRIYAEGRKRRVLVGELSYIKDKHLFELKYDPKYTKQKTAIPIGQELDLFKKVHTSKKLFPSFADRIPSRENPAYADYCKSQGISVDEKNPIILLTSIGRRGPSTFVFEPVFKDDFSIKELIEFRNDLKISRHEMALAFDFNELTLQRIESAQNAEVNTMRRIQIYLKFPEVALWQLMHSGGKIHQATFNKLWAHFEQKKAVKKTN